MPFNDSRIEHFVVLMLENRSFDHMLGFCNIPGVDGLTGSEFNPDPTNPAGPVVKVSNDAKYIGDFDPDPGHELFDVNVQIFSNKAATPGLAPPMMGFVQSYLEVSGKIDRAKRAMKCFSPQRLPVLSTLARQYTVCDRWFSSVPGPTLPNRSFAHAATSLGSAVGPKTLGPLKTIYPILSQHVSAKIFYHDFTMALTFKELLDDQTKYFGTYNDFLDAAINKPQALPNYCFLEPRYYYDDVGGTFEPSDQHPDSDIRDGEALIRDVYNALRTNPAVWQKTVLLIVYDEHGGLYDHVEPPSGDQFQPDGLTSDNPAFDFKRLGVRVPAVIVSPYVKPGFVDHTVYDHSSIITTARKLFLPDWQNTALTNRDKNANPFDGALSQPTPMAMPLAPHAAPFTPGEPRGSAKSKNLSVLQSDMVNQAYQLEEDHLPPAQRSGKTPADIQTPKQANDYVRQVTQRLREVKK
jgi:phospholipase C